MVQPFQQVVNHCASRPLGGDNRRPRFDLPYMELLSASARNKPLGTLRVQKAFIIIPSSFSGKFQSAIKSVKFFSLGGKLGVIRNCAVKTGVAGRTN